MNANATPFVPSSGLVASSVASVPSVDAKNDEGRRKNQDDRRGNYRARRRRHRRSGRNGVVGEQQQPSKEGGLSSSKETESSNDGVICTTSASAIIKPARHGSNNLTAHQRRHRQRERRRRRKGKADNNNKLLEESELRPRRSSHHATDTTNHEEEVHLVDNEISFPKLCPTSCTVPTAAAANVRSDNNTSWDECLARKLELQQLQEMQQMQKEEGEQDQPASIPALQQLTVLSSKSHHAIVDDGITENVERSKSIFTQDEETLPTISMTEESSILSTHQSTIQDNNSDHLYTSTMIPNAKSKWSGPELSKMRQRWWDAVRRKCEEDRCKKKQQQEMEGDEYTALSQSCDDSSSESTSSSLQSSSCSSDGESLNRDFDSMQPPSLNTPFDEMAYISNDTNSPSSESPIVPQSILDLEQLCLRSSHPLHCAIYNHALSNNDHGGETLPHCDVGDYYDASLQNIEKSEGEVVLHRLLTLQDTGDVTRWKCNRTSLSEMRGFEGNNAQQKESRARNLTNPTDAADLLSADATSLTPLQLAIYWNLPRIIRLCTTSGPSSSKNDKYYKTVEEEDEHGRTPLMLACELGHVACIQTIVCVSTPKLDRRERVGGNTAFHFCCMGRSKTNSDGGDDTFDNDSERCTKAFDMLLRYTPASLQKRALMSINCNGQNLLHLACSRGDLRLVERLLDCCSLPGVKISKALDAEDRLGHTPFLSAVAADRCVPLLDLSNFFCH